MRQNQQLWVQVVELMLVAGQCECTEEMRQSQQLWVEVVELILTAGKMLMHVHQGDETEPSAVGTSGGAHADCRWV